MVHVKRWNEYGIPAVFKRLSFMVKNTEPTSTGLNKHNDPDDLQTF